MKKNNKLWRKGITLLVLACLQISIFAQDSKIKGTVTEQDGAPLPGVNITVVGTTTGTITDLDGNYTLTAPSDGQLQFTFIGYATQVVDISNRTEIDVILEEDAKSLEEVVVVGYGVQRKEAVTGSVASMGGEDLNQVASSNITQALQGRIAGVELMSNSSKPGAEMQIRIRGSRSLNASNDPLIVLDGIPFAGSISDINPDDIKSLDILKDASATAIYGSRGANGVILITTQKGRKGQKPTITYSGYYGLKNAKKYPMMSGPELLKLREIADIYPNNGEDEADDVDTDWQDLFYRTGVTTKHDISLVGGTEKGSYNFGIGYYLDQAVVPTQQFSRYTLRGGIDQEVGKIFRFGFNSNNSFSIKEGDQIGLSGILSGSPLADPFNEDGTTKRIVRQAGDDSWVMTRDVLEEVGDKWVQEERGYGSYNTLYGEIKIPAIEGLKLRANIGLDFKMKNFGQYTGVGINSANATTPSTAKVRNELTTHWVIENILSYDRTFAEKHQLNFVALYSAEQSKYHKSEMEARDIPAEEFQYYNLGHALDDPIINPDYQNYTVWGLMSWMGRVMYSYDDRYMISATLRSDGSSRLAEGHKWHTYPAVSLGWNIANESFMDKTGVINKLKLRAGYGQTSNQSVSPYSTLGSLKTRPYNFSSKFVRGAYVEKLPNESLGWEFSETLNFGVDFSVLNNRLSGTVEYYSTKTKDLLLSVGLPKTSGVSSYMANIGETENKGYEISLNGVIIDNMNGWTWEMGINFYANRNKLVALASGRERDTYNSWFLGYPINSIYDYNKIGLWQEGDEHMDELIPYTVQDGENDPRIGMIKVEYTGEYDENGVPVRAINAEDKKPQSTEAVFQGGFNTRVAYKGGYLNIVGSFQRGGTLISDIHSSKAWLNNGTGRRGEMQKDYWTPDNTDAWYPNPASLKSSENPMYGSTLGYWDASFLKVRALTVGYDFSAHGWLKRAGVQNLNLYFSALNPFVMFSPFHRMSGMDPSPNSKGENGTQRLLRITATTPYTRDYLLGLKLTF